MTTSLQPPASLAVACDHVAGWPQGHEQESMLHLSWQEEEKQAHLLHFLPPDNCNPGHADRDGAPHVWFSDQYLLAICNGINC